MRGSPTPPPATDSRSPVTRAGRPLTHGFGRALRGPLSRGLRAAVIALAPFSVAPLSVMPLVVTPVWLAPLALAPLAATAAPAAPAAALQDAQSDPELRAVVQRAIAEAECFADKYDSAVWYTLMEPRLRRAVPDRAERLEILKMVFCETRREGEQRLPPGLVMGLIEVESRFDRWAVSNAGAQGLMQVMPFWPEQLGMRRAELMHVAANIRMGTAILRHYLQTEHNDVRKALERYNGSVGHREYPDLVIRRWTYWNGADDLGRTLARQTTP